MPANPRPSNDFFPDDVPEENAHLLKGLVDAVSGAAAAEELEAYGE
jgi:hypothetical protein